MIIAWFTQPPNSFSSYYQYDTTTRKFSRVRLELGRGGEGAETFASSRINRAVGFSPDRYSTGNLSDWSVNGQNRLCYQKNPLPDAPTPGSRTYDCSPTSKGIKSVHRGNAVTDKPVLPDGIEPKHLALLANDAMVTGKTTYLTEGTATPEELSAALKQRVCEVTGVETFDKVTDSVILDTLKEQVTALKSAAVKPHVASLDEALATAVKENEVIDQQIENGQFTPNEQFEVAFGSLQEGIQSAQQATGDGDIKMALEGIDTAQTSLEKALLQVEADSAELVHNQLEAAGDALEAAEVSAASWESAEVVYESLESTGSVDEYESEIFVESEPVP